ncbi:hypothetical protein ACFLTA_06640 [Bacteroidota bacterium]
MKKYLNRYWIIISIILCVLLIALFLPLSIKSVGASKALSYTITGVAVIWIVYFIRAYLFRDDNSSIDQ